MDDTNPYSAPPPAIDSPELVVERQRWHLLPMFFGMGLFPLMWALAYFNFIGEIEGLLGTAIFVWGFPFPICLLCLYFFVTKPPPIITLDGDVLLIRKSVISNAIRLNTSEVQYFAFDDRDEIRLLIVALSGAVEVPKRKRIAFWPRWPGCVVIHMQYSQLETSRVAAKLANLLDVPNQGQIG